jgi:hypothetical protein
VSVRDISGATAIVTGASGGAAATRSAGMTRSATSAKATTLTVMLGLTAAGWIVASREMSGMDTGVSTQLGSFTDAGASAGVAQLVERDPPKVDVASSSLVSSLFALII